MTKEIIFLLFSIIIIYNFFAYKIFKEEKIVKNLYDLFLEKNNIQLTIFIIKGILGMIPVKNKLAIWICRLIFIFIISLILFLIYLSINNYANY